MLEPDFRGSAGWGRKFFQAGWKQWGLAMQDDLVDGIDWLASRGTIDPKRVCIMGASYGGYAVMMGLARDPDRFRCGINYVGVTDIGLMFTVAWSDYRLLGLHEVLGEGVDRRSRPGCGAVQGDIAARERGEDPRAGADGLRRRGSTACRSSTANGCATRSSRTRRRSNGSSYPEEGHGFLLESNRFDFYSRVAKFLGQHLKGE